MVILNKLGGTNLEEQQTWRNKLGGTNLEEQTWKNKLGGTNLEEQTQSNKTWTNKLGRTNLDEQTWRNKLGGTNLEEKTWIQVKRTTLLIPLSHNYPMFCSTIYIKYLQTFPQKQEFYAPAPSPVPVCVISGPQVKLRLTETGATPPSRGSGEENLVQYFSRNLLVGYRRRRSSRPSRRRAGTEPAAVGGRLGAGRRGAPGNGVVWYCSRDLHRQQNNFQFYVLGIDLIICSIMYLRYQLYRFILHLLCLLNVTFELNVLTILNALNVRNVLLVLNILNCTECTEYNN